LGRGHHRNKGLLARLRSCSHSHQHAWRVPDDINNAAFPGAGAIGLSADEKLAYERCSSYIKRVLDTLPARVAAAGQCTEIADSPVGLAAYFLDTDARSYELIARSLPDSLRAHARRHPSTTSRSPGYEHGASGARLYGKQTRVFQRQSVSIPVAVSVFPDELYPAPRAGQSGVSQTGPLKQVEKRRPLCGLELPQLLSDEGRTGFRSLREVVLAKTG